MAILNDLTGLGMPKEQAGRLALTPSTLVTTGTSAGTAAAILSGFCILTTAGSQTGAILPSAMPLGREMIVYNPTSTTGVVYPPSGATINGASSLSVAQGLTAWFWRYSTTIIVSILSA